MKRNELQFKYMQMLVLPLLIFSANGCKSQYGDFTIEDVGKEYLLNMEKLKPGLYYHIPNDEDVIGGNTSIRNVDRNHLEWKGSPDGNGYGYYQRNRDLGQVFKVSGDQIIEIDALVLRTSRGNNAIMEGAPGAELYIIFYEVGSAVGRELKINENGTSKGDMAIHGFDYQFNRADDFIEGDTYTFLYQFTGGIFPDIPPTDQYVYDGGKHQEYGEQEGHLHYFRCDFDDDSKVILEGGKTYAFMIGFVEPGDSRGIALAIDSEVHTKEAAEFVRDANGEVVWGIRREGNGTIPPTMIETTNPPLGTEVHSRLIEESMFPKNHFRSLVPTTNGYPDVDTYRTLQFYLELK